MKKTNYTPTEEIPELNKLLFITLVVFTFGIYLLFRPKHKINSSLSTAKKAPFNVAKLFKSLGGSENIEKIENTHSRVKIFIKNKTSVNQIDIKKIPKIQGIIIGSKTVSLVIGNSAKVVKEELEDLINNC